MLVQRRCSIANSFRAQSKPWFSLGLGRNHNSIRVNDCVVLRHKGQPIALTSPLHARGRTKTRVGDIADEAIIGRRPRDVVVSSKDKELRVHIPTLEDYIVLTPRIVTPIYPADASLMVSLLDLHPNDLETPRDVDPAIQILEAGTGHGSLTLHLARAIHAANVGLTVAPKDRPIPSTALWQSAKIFAWRKLARILGRNVSEENNAQPVTEARSLRRRAVIHTVEVSPKYSELAVRNISGFCRGMYMRNIEFHISDVSEWIDQQMQTRSQKPFLSHAILDLPASCSHIEKTARALHVDGKLLVFNPSITQINSVVGLVKTKSLPLQLEKVVEIGPAMTGGRPWNVHFVKPRALIKQQSEREMADIDTNVEVAAEGKGQTSRDKTDGEGDSTDDGGWEMVCRPRPGDRVSGGGFVALWSKNRIRHNR
ncbi:MAG: hypothetical protein Q9181_001268 [Wetmoreana brouardii]